MIEWRIQEAKMEDEQTKEWQVKKRLVKRSKKGKRKEIVNTESVFEGVTGGSE